MIMLTKSFFLVTALSAGLSYHAGASQMDKISPDLEEALRLAPDEQVPVLISCAASCQPLVERLEDAGVVIKRLWPEMNLISATMTLKQANIFRTDKDLEVLELDMPAEPL